MVALCGTPKDGRQVFVSLADYLARWRARDERMVMTIEGLGVVHT